jgi:hypothetical protein
MEYEITDNTIIFRDEFNKSLDNYYKKIKDNNITHLEFGENFNQPIDLPNSITHLYLEGYFNQPIDYLPNSLTCLEIQASFNQSLDKEIQASFNQSLNNLQISFSQEKKNFINKKNRPWLFFSCYLPYSITHLELMSNFNKPINNLPTNLTHLELRNNFNQPINNLPNNITNLNLGSDFKQPIDYLPNSLTCLEIHGSFNQSIDNLQISFYQEKKKFINRRNKPWYIKSCYLPNITHLTLVNDFNQSIH